MAEQASMKGQVTSSSEQTETETGSDNIAIGIPTGGTQNEQIVAIPSSDPPMATKKPATPELSSKEKMVRELEKMKRADSLKEEWRTYEYKKLCRKNKDDLERQRLSKGVELNAGVNEAKQAIKKITDDEEFFALKKQRRHFREESALIRRKLEEKMGILIRRDNPELKQMVETFIFKPEDNSTIPEHILKVLSWSEIEDLKKAFDLFDMKSKGYINARDVKRIAKMLGFRATKVVFDEMISELAGPPKDRVTFINFLDFIVKSQGEGPDPYDEILQAFKIMDTEENGFLTLADLKQICESVNLNFSNKIIQEMIEEADNTGDGKISLTEFTSIMCQTGRFKYCAPK
ncbi:uncharacterized protein LOC143048326 isoform X3 [Mytilus galloprovincialis]|uniref:uncharacterized protein LOC143048326 isoform X3 n=1 Tax=Mytilus galloprovincialis TaxID=29158 RepID=UPI003F7C13C0